MCEQTEIDYLDGEIVWVKLGSCWWPGEVVGFDKLPPDVLPSFRKPPIAVVKFFQESTYEYVKNINCIYKYNCSRKNEFINKGLYMYRTKHGHMEKFPEDIIRAETAVGGDKEILTRQQFQEQKKESYAGLFGDTSKKFLASIKKGKGRARHPSESPTGSTPTNKFYKEKSDYQVHILLQGSKESQRRSTDSTSTPSTSRAGSETTEDKPQSTLEQSSPVSTPTVSSTGTYSCHSCSFTTSRLNVLVLHNKTHSSTFIPYTPSPIRKKPTTKSQTKSTTKSVKSPRPRKEKTDTTKKPSKKRPAEDNKPVEAEVKKPKTDQEIKSSLLADWDDVEEDSNEESSAVAMTGSPEMPIGAESPAVPLSVELLSSHVSGELSFSLDKKVNERNDNKESSSDSKYEFCEDEDWAVEADVGRKIPRVKNPSIRKEETKSISIDEDEVAKEVAELLNKTSVPELPSIPEPVKAEANFPEPPVVKSPDKKIETIAELESSDKTEVKPTKAIFKTKTFFRSRHSRSQDAIGKYVAEQLNAERLDISENDLNGSEVVSSPEARESPPIEHVKVTRLAPKIQLKKMKAEAQLREKEKHSLENSRKNDMSVNLHTDTISYKSDQSEDVDRDIEKQFLEPSRDVLYPTQEIKPINKEFPDKLILHADDKILENTNKDVDKFLHEVNTFKNNQKENKNDDNIKYADNLLNKSLDQNQIMQEVQNSTIEPHLHADDYTQNSSEPTKESSVVTTEDLEINSQVSNVHLPELDASFEGGNDLSLDKKTDLRNESSSTPQDTLLKESYVSPVTHVSSENIIEVSSQKSDQSNDKLTNKSESLVSKAYNELIQPYMNESTASAVDALLSVSRETDRVPKIVGNDPPEDLFEDDNREIILEDNVVEISVSTDNGICEDSDMNDINQTEDKTNDLNISLTSADELANSVNTYVSEDNSTVKFDSQNEVSANQLSVQESIPSESDLQIAETLLNLPSTAIQNNPPNEHHDNINVSLCIQTQDLGQVNVDEIKRNESDSISNDEQSSLVLSKDDNLNVRYETEQEKSENLNAAQSLVQMSESIEHKINVIETHESNDKDILKVEPDNTNNGTDSNTSIEQKIALLSNENNSDSTLQTTKSPKFETSSSKLLKILEEPSTKKLPTKSTPLKQVIVAPKEKILNFDVAKSPMKARTQTAKQKIIIRRAPSNKTIINNLNEVVAAPEKIILSRNTPQDGSSIQTFTIQASPEIQSSNDPKQIIIQPKFRKVTKQPKLQKIKPQNSLIAPINEQQQFNQMTTNEEQIFDINSMPVVLSEDILTPESIEKMPIVMSDGNIISNTSNNPSNPPKLIKTKPTIIENEKIAINKVQQKVAISAAEKIAISAVSNKPEVKTLLINNSSDIQKTAAPNILSKSSKLRGGKPMLVIDKTTGKQKIIMAKAEPSVKEVKPPSTIAQSVPQSSSKTEKFIILPTPGSPRPARTQKIVIDPQTGKACVLVAKGQESPMVAPDNKPVSAKIVPSSSDANTPGNTVMIITNAQGAQSRIVLTPEHEKILFPNKQQPNMSQLKTITHRLSTNTGIIQKTVVSNVTTAKTQTRIIPKQKSAIITSKGQLIVGGRVATTAQNIAPMPEVRPTPKRIVAAEPKKLVQTIQKSTSEPLIFLQQKSGAVMQLTAAQFEHLQRTGQIIQKSVAPIQESKLVVQKSLTIPPKETITSTKQRVRKIAADTTTPAKKLKQEVQITPTLPPPASQAPVPPLTSLSSPAPSPVVTISSIIPTVSNTVSVTTSQHYTDLENFEELLPSTAIVRQPDSVLAVPQPEPQIVVQPAAVSQPETVVETPPAQFADGQLLAVSGENFGGPPGSFYLCVEDSGTLTPIDSRPLVLENNQLVPMTVEPLPVFCPQPERRDILEAALANSDVFHAETPHDEAPDFRDLNANVSVHCRVSETSTTLNQPIMTPVEVPTKGESEPAVPSNLEDGLAVIGVTPHTVPTSLELPITVTDPRIAPKTTDPLSNNNYGPTLLPSPNTELRYMVSEAAGAGGVPISMPLLSAADVVGKSMPILTDETGTCSPGSPGDAGEVPRRLLTPCSDTSDSSVEIPFQPTLQLSANDLSRHV